jgi:hypothetical protein
VLEAVWRLVVLLLHDVYKAGAADVHAQHRHKEEVLQVEVREETHHSKQTEFLAKKRKGHKSLDPDPTLAK